MKNSKQPILWIVISTGISSVVLQLVSIRELLTRFQGNEFVIALILFSWLALGGIGTFLAKWLARRCFQPSLLRLVSLSLWLALLPVLQVVAIRMGYNIVFIRGSSVGFYPTFLYVMLTLAPYCLLLGFALPFSLLTLRTLSPDYPGASVYITDNIGDLAGGILFSFALVYLVSPMTALCIANLPLIAASLLPVFRSDAPGLRYGAMGLLAAGVLVAGIFLERATLFQADAEVLYYRESRYGRIEVHRQHEMRTLFIDGIPLFTNQNQQTAEEMIHYPLSQIGEAGSILVISGEGGMMQEISKYHPANVDYVELDPEVTQAEIRYGLIRPFQGLQLIHRDGRAYLAHTAKTYDAVILNLPEPDTFQLNRFFTDEFYGLVKKRLADGAVFSFAMTGFDNYLPEPQRMKLSVIYRTVKRHFRHVLLLPGQQVFFLCSDAPLSTGIPDLLAEKGIATQYIAAYYDGDLSPRRIQDLNALMDPDAPANTDYRPRILRIMFLQWFAKYDASPVVFSVGFSLFIALYLTLMSKESYALFTTGFVNMGSEILVVFAFQIIFGYVYFQIGFIVTVFLAGLLPGAWLSARLKHKHRRWLLIADGALILLIGTFLSGLMLLRGELPVSFFMGFGFLVSLASGFQFPVALHLRGESASAAAQSFSADLMGAACGTLFTSLVLIPYVGIAWAAVALMGIKVSSILLHTAHLIEGRTSNG